MMSHPVMYLMMTMMGASARLSAPPTMARYPVPRRLASFVLSGPQENPELLPLACRVPILFIKHGQALVSTMNPRAVPGPGRQVIAVATAQEPPFTFDSKLHLAVEHDAPLPRMGMLGDVGIMLVAHEYKLLLTCLDEVRLAPLKAEVHSWMSRDHLRK